MGKLRSAGMRLTWDSCKNKHISPQKATKQEFYGFGLLDITPTLFNNIRKLFFSDHPKSNPAIDKKWEVPKP
jgi:hypothetical protein